MNRPRFENNISWNAIVPVFVALVSAGAAYGLLKGDVATLENGQDAIQERAAETRGRLEETRGRVRSLEVTRGELRSDLANIRNGIETLAAQQTTNAQQLTEILRYLRDTTGGRP